MHALNDNSIQDRFLIDCCDKSAQFVSNFFDGQFSIKGPTEIIDTKKFIEDYAFELSIDYKYCANQKFNGSLRGESFILLSDSILEQSLHLFYAKSDIKSREESRKQLAEKTGDLVLSSILSEFCVDKKLNILSEQSHLVNQDVKSVMESYLENQSGNISRALHTKICNHTGIGHIQIVIFFY